MTIKKYIKREVDYYQKAIYLSEMIKSLFHKEKDMIHSEQNRSFDVEKKKIKAKI